MTLGFTEVNQLVGWYESNQAAVANEEAFAASLITEDALRQLQGGNLDPQVVDSFMQPLLDGKFSILGIEDVVDLTLVEANRCIKQAHGFFFDQNN